MGEVFSKVIGKDLVLRYETAGGFDDGENHSQWELLEARWQGVCELATCLDPTQPAVKAGLATLAERLRQKVVKLCADLELLNQRPGEFGEPKV